MIFAVAAIISVTNSSAISEERKIDLYPAWNFNGRLIPSLETGSRMVGTFDRIVFVKQENGLRDAGGIACTSDLLLSSPTSRIGGDGSCVN